MSKNTDANYAALPALKAFFKFRLSDPDDIVADNVADFLNILFKTDLMDINNTNGTYANYFNCDSLHPDLACWVEDNCNDNAKTLIEYYETELFKRFSLQFNDNLTEWFELLKKRISCYTDFEKRAYLENTAKKKKAKINGALKNRSADPAVQLYLYYSFVLEQEKCNPCTADTFACSLYSILFYLHNGYLPKIYSEQLNGVNVDRQEFVEEVLDKYGCSGNPGKHQIYQLANRESPNSIALFEAAEMEYFGNGFSSVPDYQSAYDYYSKAVSTEKYNVLAAWTLGCILYCYDDENHPLFKEKIIEVEQLSFEERIDLAVQHLKKSLDRGCPASANVLGRILTEHRVSDEQKSALIRKYHLKDGMEYFIIASRSGYTYAKNNLGKYALKETKKAGDEAFEKGYAFYKESADLGEPYAMNKYAKFYLLDYKHDKETALRYFDKSAFLAHEWAGLNILTNYCVNPEGVNMIMSLPRIHGSKEKYHWYVNRIRTLCSASNDVDILNEYTKWEKKYGKLYGGDNN